jgi:hypothetical protein
MLFTIIYRFKANPRLNKKEGKTTKVEATMAVG